jgi:hypothetical protein
MRLARQIRHRNSERLSQVRRGGAATFFQPRRGGSYSERFAAFNKVASRFLKNQRVRRWPSHRLPFVAEGLIPLIYRRACFMHRATPQ